MSHQPTLWSIAMDFAHLPGSSSDTDKRRLSESITRQLVELELKRMQTLITSAPEPAHRQVPRSVLQHPMSTVWRCVKCGQMTTTTQTILGEVCHQLPLCDVPRNDGTGHGVPAATARKLHAPSAVVRTCALIAEVEIPKLSAATQGRLPSFARTVSSFADLIRSPLLTLPPLGTAIDNSYKSFGSSTTKAAATTALHVTDGDFNLLEAYFSQLYPHAADSRGLYRSSAKPTNIPRLETLTGRSYGGGNGSGNGMEANKWTCSQLASYIEDDESVVNEVQRTSDAMSHMTELAKGDILYFVPFRVYIF